MTQALRTIGKIIGFAVILALLALPFLVHLPQPGGTKLDTAAFSMDGAASLTVRLPHSWPRDIAAGPHAADYILGFTLASDEERARMQFLLVPLTRLSPEIRLNGQPLFVTRATPWATPLFEMPHLAPLPEDVLRIGTNTLTIHLPREGGFRIGYLAPVYIGSAAEILPNYRLRSFLVDQLRITVPALYALLTLGVAGLWLARSHDRVYGWYSLMGLGFTLTVLVSINPFHLLGGGISSIAMVSISNFSSIMVFGLARVMTGKAAPRFLIPVALILTGAIFAALVLYPHFQLLGALAGLACLGWFLASVLVLIREFRVTQNMEHALTALAITALFVYGLVDIASISGLHDRGILLLLYPQIFLIMVLAVILFRRFVISLNMIDSANATLRQRLAEQEAALARAHAHETRLTVDITREEERKRLMRDLHDGLSGHIVSIIAQAEEAANSDIEKTAREAMDDLRLVIQSFEIGGEDMPIVLAYFRERAAQQLRRLGITLDWSMDRLPAITGVTPGHALALLRILQEAVTNAIKHGPARRISVTGTRAQDGFAHITIENDGRNNLPSGSGNGLPNMRQRATFLGGEVTLEPLPDGMRLTISLPNSLPATEDEA